MSASSNIADVLAGRAQWAVCCADNRTAMRALPAGSVDHVITDPPYSETVHAKQRRLTVGAGAKANGSDGKGHKVVEASLGFTALPPEVRRHCGVVFPRIARRWILAFSDQESRHLWQADLERAGGRHVRAGLWRKLNCQPQLTGDRPAVPAESIQISHSARHGERLRWSHGGHPGWWDIDPVYEHAIATDRNGNERVHTTQKPVPLMLELTQDFTDPGDLVLDPFCGSGTTGVACIRLGRRFIGIELSEQYAAVARERLEAETRGLSLTAARAGQMGLFEPVATPAGQVEAQPREAVEKKRKLKVVDVTEAA